MKQFVTVALLWLVCCVWLANGALAQTVVLPTKWELRFYLTGAASPTSTHTFLLADTTCGIDPASTQPAMSARFEQEGLGLCQWVSPAGGVLQSRPLGVAYQVALVAIHNDDDGPSPESNRVGFRLPALSPAPTGLSLRSGQWPARPARLGSSTCESPGAAEVSRWA